MLKITLYGTLSSANHFDAKERQRRVINGVGDMKKIKRKAEKGYQWCWGYEENT